MKRRRYAVAAVAEAPDTAPLLIKGDMCACLKKAAEMGYDAIEYHTRETAEIDYGAVKRAMAETGCSISMIITGKLYTEGGMSLMSDDPAKEQGAVEGMLRYIEMAATLGADVVLGWAKGRVPDMSRKDEYVARLTKNLRVIDETARKADVNVAIEVVNHYETDVFNTSKSLAEYLEKNEFTNMKIHLDSYHILVDEDNILEAIRYAKGKLGYFHLADTGRRYPGKGVLDFASILKTLDEIGYDGYCSVECLPDEDGEETARKALEYLKKTEEVL